MLKEILIRDDMGIMPASTNIEAGIISINKTLFFSLPTAGSRLFVLLHEYFHLDKNTYSEFVADELALYKLVELGFNPNDAIVAMKLLLPFDDYEDSERVKSIEKKISKYVNS